MAAQYQIVQALNLKYVTITGKTHLSELRDLATTYLGDPGFLIDHRHLIDLSGLTDAKAKFKDVFTLRNFYLRAYGHAAVPVKVAIFAPTDLGYGISRMFSSLMSGQRAMTIQIFEDVTDALVWHGIDIGKEAVHSAVSAQKPVVRDIQEERHKI